MTELKITDSEKYEEERLKELLVEYANKLSNLFLKTFSERDKDNFDDLKMGYECKTKDKTYHLVFEFKEVKEDE